MAKTIAVFIAKTSQYVAMPQSDRERLVRASDSKVKDSKIAFYLVDVNDSHKPYEVRALIEAEVAKGKAQHHAVLYLAGGRTFVISQTEHRKMATPASKSTMAHQYY